LAGRHEVNEMVRKAVAAGATTWTGRVIFRIGALLCVLLLIVVAFVAIRSSDRHYAKLRNPDLEYLKAVNSVAPPKDPELLFILMTEFANSNLHNEGAEFFSACLRKFEPS
jgi:hypothetical protein